MTMQQTLTYADMKLFMVTAIPFAFDLAGLGKDQHPVALLEKREAKSRAKPINEMKMAVADLLVCFAHESPARMAELSAALAASGAPSLARMRACLLKKSRATVQRGAIATDGEFEMMKALLDQPGLEDREREKIQTLIDRYEFGE